MEPLDVRRLLHAARLKPGDLRVEDPRPDCLQLFHHPLGLRRGPLEADLDAHVRSALVVADSTQHVQVVAEFDDVRLTLRPVQEVLLTGLLLPDLEHALLRGLHRDRTVLAHQGAVDEEAVAHRPDGGDMGQVAIGRVQGAREQVAGRRARDVPVALQAEEVGVEIEDPRVGRSLGDVVIEDQREVPPPVQVGEQRGDPPGEVGEDEDLAALLVDLLQHGGIRLLQTEAPDREALPFQRPREDGPGGEPVRIVVVKDLNGLLRHVPDFADSLFHRVDQRTKHRSPVLRTPTTSQCYQHLAVTARAPRAPAGGARRAGCRPAAPDGRTCTPGSMNVSFLEADRTSSSTIARRVRLRSTGVVREAGHVHEAVPR